MNKELSELSKVNLTKMDKKKQKGLNPKKKSMIEALKSQLGNVSLACKQLGISRQTHHNWLKDDPLYKQAYEEIDDFALDFVENALMRQIESGNITAIIFYMKCKGKNRGFNEVQQVQHSAPEGIKVFFETQDDRNTSQTE